MSSGREADTIYLDYAATTPVDPLVAEAMAGCLTAEGVFGNPASTHRYGREARARVEAARAQVAALIGARPGDVIFTSGATEANNLAILGLARGARAAGPVHVISARTEHKAVLDPCRQLEREGFAVTLLAPADDGRVTPGQLRAALRPETVLVSLMHANNETGAIQDIAAYGALCRAHGAALHVDAAQSAGKLPIDVQALGVSLLSFTAHKLYGPKGIGALYVEPSRRVALQPLMFGGGHERGVRSGTLAVHQIVGFGLACELAARHLPAEASRLAQLRARLWAGIGSLPGALLNSPARDGLPGVLNVSFAGIEGESLRSGLAELALASGSACNSDSDEPSYVLRALGRDRETAQSALRFSLGRGTSAADIDRAIAAVAREVGRLGARAQDAIDAAGLSGEAGARETGTWVRFMLKAADGRIASASFQAYGCPQTLAVCEWLAARLPGRTWPDPGLGGALDWARDMNLPADRLTRLLVIEDALRAVLRAAERQAAGQGRMTG
ncbi:MAG TPA: aminotransferase class V-fold PLP-dependent enzyme [Steroidobacteraceae bacterium]|nr:aminotransferase class V-fold PLP-dependent enzyme [Steroidobacteraceae bacterium]